MHSYNSGLLVCILLLGLSRPDPAYALDWTGLWWNSDQRAAGHMQRSEYARAARTFDDPRWRAAALYRAGRYREAAEVWAGRDDVRAHYNRGNALARAGELQAAARAYEMVLERDPGHADARHNLEVLREHMDDPEARGRPGSAQQREQQGEDPGDRDSGQEAQQSRPSSGRSGQAGDTQPEDSRPARSADAPDQSDRSPAGERQRPGDESRRKTGRPRGEGAADSDEQQPADGAAPRQPAGRGDTPSERRAAMEQWLRRIPDDPSGLLRRKFKYQYIQRGGGDNAAGESW